MKTLVVNLISGPSAGKSLMAGLLFSHLKLQHYPTEYIQEVSKFLVYTKDYEALNNQYSLSKSQYEKLAAVNGEVQFIITDGPLIQSLYYNRHNPDNVSNVDVTEKRILEWHSRFSTINFFLERNPDQPYESNGRLQNESEAKASDLKIKAILDEFEIPYRSIPSDPVLIPMYIKEILAAYEKIGD